LQIVLELKYLTTSHKEGVSTMKTIENIMLAMLLAALMLVQNALLAQDDSSVIRQRNLSGPRLGITYVGGSGPLAEALESRDVGRWISQFGWHTEYQVTPKNGGPSFVIEFVPLIAGVEYGHFIPSFSLPMGIRLENGFEIGLGPNVLLGGKDVFNTALIIAVGKTFDFRGVSIPINLAYVRSPAGDRLGLIFGYAIQRN
jgi:hypothetical protein